MTFEEAISRYKELVNTNKGYLSNMADDKTEWSSVYFTSLCEDLKSMEIILNYIEKESIPKEKIKNKLEEIEQFKTCVVIEEFQREAQIDILKELLEK